MWFGIGKMFLEKKYDQIINVPNNYSRTVRCAHFTQSRVIAKSKVNFEHSFKCDFNTPHIDSMKIVYNIKMFTGAGHTLRERALMVKNSAGAGLRKL